MKQVSNLFGKRKTFIGLLLLLHLIGFCRQLYQPNMLTLDSDDYILLAENLRDYGLPYSGEINPIGDTEVNPATLPNKGLFASRPVLYSLFIWFTGGIHLSLLLTLLVQNILSCWSVLLIEGLFRRKGFSINYTLACIGLVFFPSLWIYANWIMAETLFLFLISVCGYLLLKPQANYPISALDRKGGG